MTANETKLLKDAASLITRLVARNPDAGRDKIDVLHRIDAALSAGGDWITHDGSGMPAMRDCKLQVKFRDGDIDPHFRNAYGWRWDHCGSNGDILAYRIAEPDAKAALIERLARERDAARQYTKDECELRQRLQSELAALRKVVDAARQLSDSLNGGFVRCEHCGSQEDTTDLDFAPTLREALARLDAARASSQINPLDHEQTK